VFADGKVTEFEDNVLWRAATCSAFPDATASSSARGCRATDGADAGDKEVPGGR